MQITNEMSEELARMRSLTERMEHPVTDLEADKLIESIIAEDRNGGKYVFDDDESFEYLYLPKKDTGLPVNCFADEGAHKNWGHPVWFVFQNGYEENSEPSPITVSNNPMITGGHVLNISQSDFRKICNFVKKWKKDLIALADWSLPNDKFYSMVKRKEVRETKSRELLTEMSVLKAHDTGLPMDIWLDGGMSFKRSGHWLRIKFQAVKGDTNTRNFATMTLFGDEPEVKKIPRNADIKERDIEILKNFVKENKNILTMYSLQEISFDTLKKYLTRGHANFLPNT